MKKPFLSQQKRAHIKANTTIGKHLQIFLIFVNILRPLLKYFKGKTKKELKEEL